LKVKTSLGLKRQDGCLVVSASELPVSVGVVSAARLEHSDGSKLLGLESNSSLFRLVHGIAYNVISVPFSFFLVPNSDLNHGRILRHEKVVRHFNSDLNRVVNHSHSGVGEGDDLQAFFNRKNAAHSPFELSLSDLGVGVHAEVHNSTHHNVSGLLSESQVVKTGPEVTDNDLHGSVLLGKRGLANLFLLGSARVELEDDTFVGHVLRSDVCPDSKDEVLTVENHLNKVFLGQVSLASLSLILFSFHFSNFFRSSL
jgi:hypothetical protein